MTLTGFLLVYVFGGLTFLPLLVAAVLLHAYLTSPDVSSRSSASDGSQDSSKNATATKCSDWSDIASDLPDELKPRRHEPDVAAGYFAVCREYVPGGVNGKPPEKTSPGGGVAQSESPSVYQSMYRSIFDRKKSKGATLDGPGSKDNSAATGRPRRANNVFYVVLRLGHLMLYDDADQLEVRHVISLAHHGVDIYGGGEVVPEGELFVKRNCIRLTTRRVYGQIASESRPFFLFSENCSDKEDFYHALLANQERKTDKEGRSSSDNPPTPLLFEQTHLIKLVQQLHASGEDLQTRWFNALIGRIFLSLYKTAEVEDYLRTKITKKIARVQKPAFIDSIAVRDISLGSSAPMFTNPKLRELTMDGDITIEADVKYNGGIGLEIAAVARIDLGSRLKAREVDLVLAAVLKKLEGRVVFRIKPPPSNRIWFSFETSPKMEMSIEPIVSTRQITYGIILRAIESRIREVLGETLVHPNWDDVPFHNTLLQRFRGGLWEDDVKPALDTGGPVPNSPTSPEVETKAEDTDTAGTSMPTMLQDLGRTTSLPFLANTAPSGLHGRGAAAKSTVSVDEATSSGVESLHVNGGKVASSREKSMALRSNSFASTSGASTIVNTDSAGASAAAVDIPASPSKATAAFQDISARHNQRQSSSNSPSVSPLDRAVGSPERSTEIAEHLTRAVHKKTGSISSYRSTSSASAGPDMDFATASALLADSKPVGRDGPDDAESESEAETETETEAQLVSPVLPRRMSGASKTSSGGHSRNNSTADLTAAEAAKILGVDAPITMSSKPSKAARLLNANKRQSLASAGAAAKRWGLSIMAARQQQGKGVNAEAVPSTNGTSKNLMDVDSERSPSTPRPITPPVRTSTIRQKPSRASLHNTADIPRSASPSSLLPRRISSQSLVSAASPMTQQPPRSTTLSRIPTLSQQRSSSSLRKTSPSTSPSTPSNTTVSPTPTTPYGPPPAFAMVLAPAPNPKRNRPHNHFTPPALPALPAPAAQSPHPSLESEYPPCSPMTLSAPTPATNDNTSNGCAQSTSFSGIPKHDPASAKIAYGRGQPLPPPGQPLPGPPRPGTLLGAASALGGMVVRGLQQKQGSMKRKPVGGQGGVGSVEETEGMGMKTRGESGSGSEREEASARRDG